MIQYNEEKRPLVKIQSQTANTTEVYIGDARIIASGDCISIEANGMKIEVKT